MFNFFKKVCNEVRKEVERERYFSNRFRWRVLPNIPSRKRHSYSRRELYYQRHFEELTMIFDNQRVMLDKNIIEYIEWRGRADITEYFKNWCKRNLKGFYSIHGWGNGNGNSNQDVGGIWCIHVDVMRKSDKVMLKMVWG